MHIKNYVRQAETLPQMSLGELIAKLERIASDGATLPVVFAFEYAYPTTFASWRGSYRELALGWAHHGYGACAQGSSDDIPTVATFLEQCRSTVGKTFEGWKGGDYVMREDTPIWVANPGNSGATVIVDVVQRDYEVTLITQYCEF